MRARLLAPLLLAVASLGSCSTDPSGSTCGAEAIADCLVDQRACTLEGGAPTCARCGPGTRVAGATGTCEALAGTPLRHEFPENATMPGEKISGLCRSWTLGNDEELWVTAVELEQDELSHHSNWIFAPEGMFDGPDGTWPCRDRGYDQLSGAVAGGVLYAQSTQASHEVQAFAPGAAIRIPPRSRLISDIHVLNTTGAPARGHVTLTLYTVPRSEVTTALAPFHLEYHALDIPARGRARFVAECPVGPEFRTMFEGAPYTLRLHYSLPHTHALGTRVFLEAVGGAHDGESLLDVRGFNGEARGVLHDPIVDLSDVETLRFGCEFENPTAENVGYGIGDQEMCEMLGFIESPVAFESRVSERVPMGAEDGMPVFGGPCTSLLIPWQDRGL
jgi:hypothetical protein